MTGSVLYCVSLLIDESDRSFSTALWRFRCRRTLNLLGLRVIGQAIWQTIYSNLCPLRLVRYVDPNRIDGLPHLTIDITFWGQLQINLGRVFLRRFAILIASTSQSRNLVQETVVRRTGSKVRRIVTVTVAGAECNSAIPSGDLDLIASLQRHVARHIDRPLAITILVILFRTCPNWILTREFHEHRSISGTYSRDSFSTGYDRIDRWWRNKVSTLPVADGCLNR